MSAFKKKNLQTPNEQRFFECLKSIFPDNHIAVQVAMSVIVESEDYKDRSQFRTYYLDYVVCDKKGMEPLLVIELDDRTHCKKKRIEQDQRKNSVLHEAKIPFVQYQAQKSYSITDVKKEI